MVAVCCGYPQRVRKMTEEELAEKRQYDERARQIAKAVSDAFYSPLR